jgi:GTPase SAR1 family protein
VGGQSSGKSSLLENLTGFSFPRGQGLCTRYATQITLRQSAAESVVISIIPRRDADQDLEDRLRAFRHELVDFDGKQLAGVIEKVSERCFRSNLRSCSNDCQANKEMGIRVGASKDDASLPMFSDDILKVEISGPEVIM